MKTISKMIAALAATTVLAASAAYANGGGTPTGNVTVTATANVITPATISQTQALSFGTFAAYPAAAGVIDSSGNVVSGSVNVVTPGTPATFNVTGVSGNSYTIVPPPNPVVLTGVSTQATMPATLTFPSSPRPLAGTGGTGADNFNVTGTLAVAAGQLVDNYSGNYTVSVHY